MRQLMDNKNTELNDSLQDLIQWLFCEPNPIGINTAMMMTDAVLPNFRLPYKALNKAQRQQGFELLAALNSDDIVGDSLSLLDDSDFKYCV
jgi:4-hydroxy-tetrahydrodipicolinate synthase